MKAYDTIEYVELFHLLFLDFFGRKADKKCYVLKGGCNLRFFMNSVRYSEDIDFDVHAIRKDKLDAIVCGILRSEPFAKVLRVNGLELERWSAPKQTETTQRWKMLLKAKGYETFLNTKIEFSRRGSDDGATFEPLSPLIVGKYSLRAIMCNHYGLNSAFKQKLKALLSRSVTQARDIFDLHMLIDSGADTGLIQLDKVEREAVTDRAVSVTHAMFMGQVVSYLAPEYRRQYSSEDLWNDIVLRVVGAITGKQP
jgi:predicted nucleotidyltransferase component of viral defense system